MKEECKLESTLSSSKSLPCGPFCTLPLADNFPCNFIVCFFCLLNVLHRLKRVILDSGEQKLQEGGVAALGSGGHVSGGGEILTGKLQDACGGSGRQDT